MSPGIDDDDEVEEGQLVTSPGRAGRAEGRASDSPVAGPAAGSQIPASDSPAKSRNRFRSRSRSHSRSRRRRSGSRSKRRRSGSRSRSPYAGPVIRDMRRGGRNRQNRFPRGRRPFKNQSRRSRSRSTSRTPSPRRVSRKSESPAEQKQPEHSVKNGRRETSSAEKTAAAGAAAAAMQRQLRPEDIKNQAKADTMSFLAMLHEKKQVNKMIPINLKTKSTAGNDAEGDGHAKSHGFVSTFASLAGRMHEVDASGDEDDGWEVVDDARSTHSPHKRLPDQRPAAHLTDEQKSPPAADSKLKQPLTRDDSHQVKSKDKKKKKSSRREEGKKKKRKEKRRKQSASESSDESDAEHKKQRKRKRSASPTAKSSSKVCKLSQSEASALKEPEEKRPKKERKEKKRSKRSRRSVSVSDSERISRKKSKKKKSKKSSQKKKKRKSSSESSGSESGSGSEAVTMEMPEKKRMRDEEKPSARRSPDAKTSPTTFEFPRSVLLYTQTQPSIQYCRNPRTILLNPADDTPRTKTLPADPPSRAAGEHASPEKRSSEQRSAEKKPSGSSNSARRERGSPPALVEQRASCDSKKDEDDDHDRGKEKGTSGTKTNLPSKWKRDDHISDSSEKRDRDRDRGEERSQKAEPGDKSVVDSVKQELLQKVAQKRKENGKPEGKDVKLLNDKIVIGKMKQSRKPGRREDKSTPLDMNQDYGWYQQHYANSYAMDPYTAAYYAQYAMVTSGDYTNPDITAWLQGYGFAYDPNNTASMPLLPPTDADANSNQISVLVSDVPGAAVEQFFQPCDASQTADSRAEEMDVESDDDCPSPPAPPPPPHITTLLVEQAFSLPNGQEVPAGTKQVIVHPYPESHPLSSHFTPEFVQSSVNSLQSSKCEDKAGRVVPNGASNSTSVVT